MGEVSRIEVWRMQAGLSGNLRQPNWPQGIVVTEWDNDAAPAIYDLLKHAYARGGGAIAPTYEAWFTSVTNDPEFDPSLCIVAVSERDIVGVALCWSSSFVKDLCVAERWRNQGLGQALLQAAMVRFADRNERLLTLKVNADNPYDAHRLYLRCGFTVVERIQFAVAAEP